MLPSNEDVRHGSLPRLLREEASNIGAVLPQVELPDGVRDVELGKERFDACAERAVRPREDHDVGDGDRGARGGGGRRGRGGVPTRSGVAREPRGETRAATLRTVGWEAETRPRDAARKSRGEGQRHFGAGFVRWEGALEGNWPFDGEVRARRRPA